VPELVEPVYAKVLLDEVHRQHLVGSNKPHAADTPFRHSDSGACARKLAFKYKGVPESNGFDGPSEWVAWLGTHLHEYWQRLCKERWNIHAKEEYPVWDEDKLASGSLDLLHFNENAERVCVEMKTVNGTKFQYAVGVKKGKRPHRIKAKGPNAGHVIQLALNTIDSDADYGIIFYLSTEALSKFVELALDVKDLDRYVAEWKYTREELEPIAEEELRRLRVIKYCVDTLDTMPQPLAVDDDFTRKLLDPRTNENWECLYCSHRDVCLETFVPPTEEERFL
jgi:hypothetical protein